MIQLVKGDILSTKSNIILNDVACKREGDGPWIYDELSAKYPEVWRAYLERSWALGDLQYLCVDRERPLFVVNMAIYQAGLQYPYLYLCFTEVLNFAHLNQLSVAMSQMGRGSAAEDILRKCHGNRNVQVKVYTPDVGA